MVESDIQSSSFAVSALFGSSGHRFERDTAC